MKIGFFSDFYLPQVNGVAYSIETFRIELEKLGHEVYIIAPAPGLRFRETTPRSIRFPAVRGLFFEDYLTSLFFPPQVAYKLDRIKLDVVHFHTPSQVGLLGAYYALRKDIPLVATYHTDLHEYVKHYPAVLPGVVALSLALPFIVGGGIAEYRASLSSMKPERNVDRWNQKIVEKSITTLHGYCDSVVSPSRKVRRQLQMWQTKSRLEVIPTGVDALPATDLQINKAKSVHGIQPGDEVVLFVGRMGGEKNPGLIIKAFGQLASRRPQAKLMMVGEGPDLDELKASAADSRHASRIIFTGAIDHSLLGAIYGLAEVFAFPSLADTQGMVLNEAAAAGLPIVMIDEQITEVVRNGENGYYARAVARDFAASIENILADPQLQRKMAVNSRHLAAQFSAAGQAAKLAHLYEEIIASHKSKPRPKSPKNLFRTT